METPDGPMPEASHNGWTDEENAVLDAMNVARNRAARRMLSEAAQRTGLNPFSRQIYVTFTGGWWKVETSIHGMRAVAASQARYRGQEGPYWCGKDGEWRDVWPSDDLPVAAKVGIRVADSDEPTWGVVHFDEFAVRAEDGSLEPFWQKMPRNQLAKCAEAQGLRKEFSHHLGGIYTPDEVSSADAGSMVPGESWEQNEKRRPSPSSATAESPPQAKGASEQEQKAAEAFAAMEAILDQAQGAERYEKLRALWAKTPERVREASTPDGQKLKEHLLRHLRQEHQAAASGESAAQAPPAEETGPAHAPDSAAKPPPKKTAGKKTAGKAPTKKASAKKAAVPRQRGSRATPGPHPAPPEAPPEASTPEDASEEQGHITLGCGCDRAEVMKSGTHGKQCTSPRRRRRS